MKLRFFSLFLLLGFPLFAPSPSFASPAYTLQDNLVYKTTGSLQLKFSLCSPPSLTTRRPIIVFFHGGGLEGGERSQGINLLCELVTSNGYLLASADYRLYPDYPYPAQLDDAQFFLRYLRSQANIYQLDPNQIIVAGTSAGSSLAGVVATMGDTRNPAYGLSTHSSRAQGAILLAGVYNFAILDDLGTWNPRATVLRNNPLYIREFSAITHVSSDDGPFLLLHGTQDTTNLPLQSTKMQTALSSAHVPVRLLTFPAEHVAGNYRLPLVQQAIVDYLDQYFPLSPTQKPGDLNSDGAVNILDYNLLVSSYGNPYTIFDYNVLVEHFGQ